MSKSSVKSSRTHTGNRGEQWNFQNDANPRARRLFPSYSPNIDETTFEILIVLPLWTYPTGGDDVDLR